MKKHMHSGSLMIVMAAGAFAGVANAEEPVAALGVGVGSVSHAAHIYYNLATGERVVTLVRDGQSSGADSGSSDSLWASLTPNQCADQGFNTTFYFGVDDPGTTSLSTAVTLLDYGDIAHDTVVDCVHVNWVTQHLDQDADSDGLADGVRGLGAQWVWWDIENGRGDRCDRSPLIGITLTDLPGHLGAEGALSRYSVDIDLSATFTGTSLTFEICDTDSDTQGASYHNAGIGNLDGDFDGNPDVDIDGDGLSDWGWHVRFYQPGTVDFDSDGSPDGVAAPAHLDAIGVSFGAPDGVAIDNGDGTWSWEIDTSTADAGTGQEDRFAFYSPPDINGDSIYAGGFNFGGFSCTAGTPGGAYTPSAMFEHQLFGPAPFICCCADLNGDGVLNFFDVSVFLNAFNAGDSLADYNNDGSINFFDVSSFVSEFNAGCP